jgi:glutathione S-transferase
LRAFGLKGQAHARAVPAPKQWVPLLALVMRWRERESGAIIDYVIRRHAAGRLQPDPSSAAFDDYMQWMHYAEGSAMLPLLLKGNVSRLGEALTGADIQLSFVGELAGLRTDRTVYPNLDAWVRRFQARPAYKAAIARGGPYSFAS